MKADDKPEKIVLNWSGGKDCTLCLYELLRCKKNALQIVSLLSVLNKNEDSVTMHRVPRSLLEQQAMALSLPLDIIYITENASDKQYERAMKNKLIDYKQQGVSVMAFGDIFLENLRKFREEKLAEIKMKAVFPIWKKDTSELADRFINSGFRTVITCVDKRYLDESFVGRNFDKQFLSDLPAGVDRCGENGEFHSFTYDGPIFNRQVSFSKGPVLLKNEHFCYCDLLAA